MVPGTSRRLTVPEKVRDALADIIDGNIVKRSKHDLLWGATDCTEIFTGILAEKNFRPCHVCDIDIAPGERVPAFYLEKGTAFFGWIFWEKFSKSRMRKLFGSVVRNAKGDWAVQIPEKKTVLLYANILHKAEMDIDNPTGF